MSPEIPHKLKELSLFKAIAAREDLLAKVQKHLTQEVKSAGTEIIREGDPGDRLYLLIRGDIEIIKRTLAGDAFTVAQLNDSMNVFFGELALVDEERRSATVVARSECELWILSRASFLELGKESPEAGWLICQEIAHLLSKKLRKANEDTGVLFEALIHEISA